MRILVIGSGGREHALVWKLSQSPRVKKVFCVPGNAGIAQEAETQPGDVSDPVQMADLAQRLRVDLTVVGPEAPLVAGIADEFAARELPVVGPARAAARLEGSKIFAKQFMRSRAIPTADFEVCETPEEARRALGRFGFPVVLKADGLAAGKGVVVAANARDAQSVVEQMISGKLVGDAGRRLVIEKFLLGEEVTFTILTDGSTVVTLPPTQDHKAVFDNDQGPNTGGMGAYSDDSIVSDTLRRTIMEKIVTPTITGLAEEGAPFRGFLYFGLMVTREGPQLLEYNARLGDPEAQALMARMASDLAPLAAAAAAGNLKSAPTPDWKPGAAICIVAASGGYPGAFERDKVISGLTDAEAFPGVKVFHAGTRRDDNGRFLTAGGRVLGVTAWGGNLRAASMLAYAAIEKIRFEGLHYRRDIGKKGLAKAR